MSSLPCVESSLRFNETWMSCEQNQHVCSCPNHLTIPASEVVAPHAALALASDPTFEHLTTTNDGPTCIEEVLALGRVTSLKAHRLSLATYTKKLEVLRAKALMQAECVEGELERISGARVLVDNALRVREAVLSSARRLPTNVLAIIFEYSIEFPMKCEHYPSRSLQKYNVLWSFELVCKRWRDVVIHSSHLWSFIGVDLSLCSQPSYMRMLAKQIVRAGLTTAVSVSVYSTSGYERDGTMRIGVAAILLPLAPCMQEIDLRISPLSADTLNLWSNSLHSLKRLFISRDSVWHDRQPMYRGKCHAFESAPKLVYLETDETTFGLQEPFVLPQKQILRYSNDRNLWDPLAACGRGHCLNCSSPAVVLSALSNPTFRNLKECRVFLSTASGSISFHGLEVPVVSGIQSLTLLTRATGQNALAIEQLLDSVYLPELKELTVDLSPVSKERLETNLFRCICDALERAQPPLASFCFKQGVVPP
ncbi:hypothetical protein CPB85DRAFT_102657 [Mucidula mucida]|nr:hypothetical protein CPB85DRAFT_102657 [Mucidula mucida]